MRNKKLDLPAQYRDIQIRQEDIDKEKRTINLTFSSETLVERWWGNEILDHSSDSVSLERLRTAGPLLVIHDRSKQIGKVISASIGEDRKGHAAVRFGRSRFAEEIFQDVQDGIRDTISVGYIIHEAKLEKQSDKEGDTYRITSWEPFEISLEPTPADYSVGVGRNRDNEKTFPVKIDTGERSILNMEPTEERVETRQEQKPPADPPVDTARIEQETRERETRRFEEIVALGETFAMRAEAMDAIKKGLTVDQFRQKVLDKIANNQHIDTQQANLGMPKKDLQNYSVLRGIQALILNKPELAGLEMEASREIAERLKQQPKGFFIPHDVLLREIPGKFGRREITTASGGTGLIATEHLAGSFIDLLRNRALLMQLGMRVLSGLVGNASIPKKSGAGSAYWVAESGDVTLSDSAFTALALAIKTVGAATAFSRNMLLQSNPSIEGLVLDDLAVDLALAIDLAGIAGTGLTNEPTGILNTSGIGSVTGTTLGWTGVVEFETDVRAANGDIGSMAYLTNATVNGLLKTREKSSGYPIFLQQDGQMNGYPVAVSNQVPAVTMIFGVFSQIILGLWGGLDIWPDPYANAPSGGIVIRAFQSCDIGVRQPAAFSASEDIT